MNRSAAVTEIKRGVGFRPTQEPTILSALQEAQRILETGRTLPEWLIVYDADITVTADNPNFALPSDFLRLHEDYDLYYTNTGNARVFLPRKDSREAYLAFISDGSEDAIADTSNSPYPKVWVRRGKTAGYFYPTPTTSFTAKLTYYKKAQVLTSDIENEWLANAPDLIIGLAGIQVAGILRDKDAMAQFTTRYKMGLGSFIGDVVEDELAGRPLMMGRDN